MSCPDEPKELDDIPQWKKWQSFNDIPQLFESMYNLNYIVKKLADEVESFELSKARYARVAPIWTEEIEILYARGDETPKSIGCHALPVLIDKMREYRVEASNEVQAMIDEWLTDHPDDVAIPQARHHSWLKSNAQLMEYSLQISHPNDTAPMSDILWIRHILSVREMHSSWSVRFKDDSLIDRIASWFQRYGGYKRAAEFTYQLRAAELKSKHHTWEDNI